MLNYFLGRGVAFPDGDIIRTLHCNSLLQSLTHPSPVNSSRLVGNRMTLDFGSTGFSTSVSIFKDQLRLKVLAHNSITNHN